MGITQFNFVLYSPRSITEPYYISHHSHEICKHLSTLSSIPHPAQHTDSEVSCNLFRSHMYDTCTQSASRANLVFNVSFMLVLVREDFVTGTKYKCGGDIFHPETRQMGIHKIIHCRNVSAVAYLPNANVAGTSTIHRWNGPNSNEHLIGRGAQLHSYQPIKGHIKIRSLATTLLILNTASNTLASNVKTKQYAHSAGTVHNYQTSPLATCFLLCRLCR